ncbi:hypothetical protein HYC85_024452 [Camellia sinensis]|uniref:non-specific serine/threonine protein kinase n=1 Tax=Camellia sinensis TaxID=4442 RepID=A0A7J7GCC3_CAMSI|nr:hypothetical protein HYC85_024452 [Camellia sinensis]
MNGLLIICINYLVNDVAAHVLEQAILSAQFPPLELLVREGINASQLARDLKSFELKMTFEDVFPAKATIMEEYLQQGDMTLFLANDPHGGPTIGGVIATDKIVGYGIDYCPGRDLNSLRKKQTEKMFSDSIIRFYAAELVLALEYLYGLGVVYRDLKPESILVQESGHLMSVNVDFDLSAKLCKISSNSSDCAIGSEICTDEQEEAICLVISNCHTDQVIDSGKENNYRIDSRANYQHPLEAFGNLGLLAGYGAKPIGPGLGSDRVVSERYLTTSYTAHTCPNEL